MKISELEIKVIKIIDKAVQSGISEIEILEKIRGIINSVPEFNIREKSRAYLACKKLLQTGYDRAGQFKPANMILKKYMTSMNKINEHSRARIRTEKLAEQLRQGRANCQVFFLSSSHSNPACGHADYQGRIYVDRFWKKTLEPYPTIRKQVAAYIRNHDIMTVQAVCKEPVFLVTRPYCKHFFVGVSVDEVLRNSVRSVVKKHPESHVREHNINYRKKFYKLRYRIHTVLNMSGEAQHDLRVIKRQG